MRAKDVMCSKVITIAAQGSVRDAARKLLEHRISALPVVDPEGHLVGVVSEGDLLRRTEIGTERKRGSWWLRMVTEEAAQAMDFVKSHAAKVSDVMTSPAISVSEDTDLNEIAEILEEKHIKRVPVVRDDALVGVVSRADLVRALATSRPKRSEKTASGDTGIRKAFLKSITDESWFEPTSVNVIVTNGTIHLWGWARNDDVIEALRVAAERVPGARAVEMHLGKEVPWMWGY